MLSASNTFIGMIYINVGDMCFIPMNVHNELFRCQVCSSAQMATPFACSIKFGFTSCRLLSSVVTKHCIIPSYFSLSLSLSVHLSLDLSFCD